MIHCTNCAAPCKNPYRYNDKHRKYTKGNGLSIPATPSSVLLKFFDHA